MIDRLKASGLESLARQQVDGIVRRNEDGAEYFVESTIPSTCKHKITAHEGGCASILFETILENWSVGDTTGQSRCGIQIQDHYVALLKVVLALF